MKLFAYYKDGFIQFSEFSGLYPNFIGTIDLDIQKPKKTVVREATEAQQIVYSHSSIVNGYVRGFIFPNQAKNSKPPTYEIEE